MNAATALRERVDRFVAEMSDLVRQAGRAAALEIVTQMLGERWRVGSADTKYELTRAIAVEGRMEPSAPPRRSPPAAAPASTAAAPTEREPASTAAAPTEREQVVLGAVRGLVRGTAAELAEHCGVPNGSVYVTLRSLARRRLVARTPTKRGIEYSLLSTGGVRPFKRAAPLASR